MYIPTTVTCGRADGPRAGFFSVWRFKSNNGPTCGISHDDKRNGGNIMFDLWCWRPSNAVRIGQLKSENHIRSMSAKYMITIHTGTYLNPDKRTCNALRDVIIPKAQFTNYFTNNIFFLQTDSNIENNNDSSLLSNWTHRCVVTTKSELEKIQLTLIYSKVCPIEFGPMVISKDMSEFFSFLKYFLWVV